ncbi:MAG: EF-P lysine aminoacylase GenX [Deltaproteobacteria bacterium]|nr:EF-P lysine aminoacylase GenX [Deltaproteobacteria bacterium]
MPRTGNVLAPADLAEQPDGWKGVIGGRVTSADQASVFLADALAEVSIGLAPGQAPPLLGGLVTLEAEKKDGAIVGAIVRQSLETARGGALPPEHDRLLRRGVGRNLAARARAIELVRQWFGQQKFIEVDTPQRVPSPGLDLHLDAFASDDAYLITSPEYQMKRLLAGGMHRIFQLVHCFRRGEVGGWHNPEFLMLEWYRAFAGIGDVMSDTEQLVAHVVQSMRGEPVVEVEGRRIDVKPPYDRLTVCEAFESYAGTPEAQVLQWAEHDEDAFFEVLVNQVEPGIAQRDRAVFLVDYPAQQASLARLKPGDPRFCERFELCVGGHELCNGFGELVDPTEQKSRLERDTERRRKAGMPMYPIDAAFLESMIDGIPPSGGNALGLDRLIALTLGLSGIGSVLAFSEPWLRGTE